MRLQIEDLFAAGALVRPDPAQPSLVHLARAVARLSGADDVAITPPATQLADLIGPSDHLVFLLIDGLGMNTVARLPAASFIARHLKLPMLASSPSTTACALTSLASGEFSGQHGIAGWFTHLPELALTATVLPFVERFTSQPLAERGIRPDHVLPATAWQARMKRDSLTVLPEAIAHTTYARWARGSTRGHGYATPRDAVDGIIEHVNGSAAPTYAHLYLPEVDTLCHTVGVDHPDVVSLVMQIDAELARLKAALGERARVVITADHGLIDVPADQQTLLEPDDPIVQLLQCPLSGDARMPVFHVKADQRAAFVDAFEQRFGDRMALLDLDSVDRLELFGPSPMSPHARHHFGDFVAIHAGATSLSYRAPGRPIARPYKGLHAGLSPQEMWVPVCVA